MWMWLREEDIACLLMMSWCARVHVQVFTEINGTVVNAPGVPPMYDWEYLPQAVSEPSPESMFQLSLGLPCPPQSPPPPVSFGKIFRGSYE